jgi:hypothetical protein
MGSVAHWSDIGSKCKEHKHWTVEIWIFMTLACQPILPVHFMSLWQHCGEWSRKGHVRGKVSVFVIKEEDLDD